MNYQTQVLIASLVPVAVLGFGFIGVAIYAIIQIRRGKL